MTLVELQARRDALILEIAKANQQLSSPAGSVTKRSVGDLQKALSIIDSEISKVSSSGTSGSSTIGRFYTNEGL